MIFHKLKIESSIFGFTSGNPPASSLTSGVPTLVTDTGTVLTAGSGYTTGFPPTLFPGLETKSNKYFSYIVNDSTTTRQAKTVRLGIYYQDSTMAFAELFLLIPANVPVRIHIPQKTVEDFLTANSTTYSLVNQKFLGTLNPAVSTFPDVFTVYSYERT